jgi:hypothetical protein
MVLTRLAAAVLVTGITAAGCTNLLGPRDVITAADRHRLAVMRADPIFRTTVPGTGDYSLAGELWSPGSWRRGEVLAEIYRQLSSTGTLSPLPVQAFARNLITGMQARGWKAYYASCNVQSFDGGTPAVTGGPATWTDIVYAYRIYQGVSYWASLWIDINDSDGPGFESDVQATMLVPAASEPANLFPDRPAGIPVSQLCAARSSQLTAPVAQGSPIAVSPQSDTIDPATPGPGDTSR